MMKQAEITNQAIKMIDDWDIDGAPGLLAANDKLLGQPSFMKHYIRRASLKKYHIKDVDGFEYGFDQLAHEKWWKVLRVDGDTIYIAKTGKNLIYDVKNLKAIKGFN